LAADRAIKEGKELPSVSVADTVTGSDSLSVMFGKA
jgi:hypothetical protein